MVKSSLPYSGYVRISKVGDRSGPSFISEDIQRDTIARLGAFHGVELDEVVAETDVSGKTPIDERELGRLVRKIEDGESGGLLVWKVSRFSRNLLDGVTVADRITRAGGRLIADDFDSSNAMGKAILGFLLGWAEEELDSRRTGWREAQRRAAARGAYPSRTPLGYRKDDEGRLVIDPATADTVTRIFRMRATGSTLGECAAVLNAPASSVRALLSNPAYLGRIDHGSGETAIYVEKAHDALTDERTWHLAQRGDGPPKRTGSLKGKGSLLGLIRCAGCGQPLTATASGPPDARVASYTCRKRRAGSVCAAPAGARVDAVDALVWPGVEERTPERNDWRVMAEAEELGARHQEAVEELDAFLETALVTALGSELYAREVARRREEVALRWAAFERAERQGRALLRLGETSGIEHDRARARQVLESVTLAKSTRGRWQPLDERVEVVWKSTAEDEPVTDDSRVKKLPPATREEQLKRHGLTASHRWGEAERSARPMPESPEDDVKDDGSARAFLLGEDGHGATSVDTSRGRGNRGTRGARDAGMTAHRGVLHPDEHVDTEALRAAVEAELGFTYEDFARVSGGGRPRKANEELARHVNARLAHLHRAGANFAVLAACLGVTPQALGERARKAAEREVSGL